MIQYIFVICVGSGIILIPNKPSTESESESESILFDPRHLNTIIQHIHF